MKPDMIHMAITDILVMEDMTEKVITSITAGGIIHSNKIKEEQKMAEERKCFLCIYCRRDPGSNWGWYCDRKSTHVRPEDYCGYFSPKY